MRRDGLPPAAFLDPRGENRDEVARVARELLEMVLDHGSQAAARSPLPGRDGCDEPAGLPADPVPLSEIIPRLRSLLAGAMNPAHPGYIGHMDPMPTTLSVLGDLVAAAANNNLLSAEMSPTFSRLEIRLLRSFAERFGLGPEAGGVLASGGTLANLHALAVARNRAFDCIADGIAGSAAPPALLASELAHVSLRKASMLLGLGTSAVIPVATTADGRMDVEHLREAVRIARERGAAPFCVVATAGTTTTGSIDPLDRIAEVAREEGLWLHVDAAYGGALVFSPRLRSRLRGIERADSVTFNPQKWLYVAKTCAMVLFRDFDGMAESFRIAAPYMGESAEVPNLGELSIQGTRHADVIKLWLSLQHVGAAAHGGLIEEACRLAEILHRSLRSLEGYEVTAPPETNIVCFRALADGSPERQDARNAELQRSLLERADLFVSLPLFRGRRWLRAVLLNPFTGEGEIRRLVDHLRGELLTP